MQSRFAPRLLGDCSAEREKRITQQLWTLYTSCMQYTPDLALQQSRDPRSFSHDIRESACTELEFRLRTEVCSFCRSSRETRNIRR